MKSPWTQMRQPPRSVSIMLAAQMFLASIGVQIAWALFGFGSLFFWIFGWHADLSGWRFGKDTVRVMGSVEDCHETSYSIGGSDGAGGSLVIMNRYKFEVNGIVYSGISYETGVCAEGNVTIEYLRDRPEISRIQGMRRDILGPWGVLVGLLPGIALAFIVVGGRKAFRRVRLLRNGVLAPGSLVSKEATNVETMGRRNYRATVAYSAGDGSKHSVVMRTNRPEALESHAGATVLHDPARPEYAEPVADFPGTIRADSDGNLKGGGILKFLIAPGLAMLINALFIWPLFE